MEITKRKYKLKNRFNKRMLSLYYYDSEYFELQYIEYNFSLN